MVLEVVHLQAGQQVGPDGNLGAGVQRVVHHVVANVPRQETGHQHVAQLESGDRINARCNDRGNDARGSGGEDQAQIVVGGHVVVAVHDEVKGVPPVGFRVHVEDEPVQQVLQQGPSQDPHGVPRQGFHGSVGRLAQQVGDDGGPENGHRPPGTLGGLL